MSDTPNTKVTDAGRPKPRLLVFDDNANELADYCAELSKNYDVEGVLVSCFSNVDATMKNAFESKNWTAAAQILEADIDSFDSVKHLVTSQEELRSLLKERKPDFVLSDLQMRPKPPQLMGTDVMRIVSEELPSTPRALHTRAGFARDKPVKEMGEYDRKERASLVKAMMEYGFKAFPKPMLGEPFDASPIIEHFSAASGRAMG